MKKVNLTHYIFISSLIAVSILSYLFYNRLQALILNYNWVNHTLEVTRSLEKLHSTVSHAEAETRGFLLTQNESFIRNFNEVAKQYPKDYENLKNKTTDNSEQIKNLIKLDSLCKIKFEYMHTRIKKNNYTIADIAFSESIMNEIRFLINKMLDNERKLLKLRESALNYKIYTTPLFLLIISLISVLALIISFIYILRQTKRNTKALTEQKEYVETIINSAEEWIVVYDVDYNLKLINDSSAKALGRNKEDLIGKSLFELFPQVKGTKSVEDLAKAFKGEQVRNLPFVSPVTNKWLQNYILPLHDINGKIYGALAIAQDVTEIIKSHEDLKKSQQHFSLLFNVSPVAKTLSRIRDGKVIDVNSAWENMFNKRKEDVIGKNASEINISDPAERAEKMSIIQEKGGTLEGTEMKFNTGNGKTVYAYISVVTIDIDGEACLLAAYFNITNLKLAEDQLKSAIKLLAEKNLELEEAQRLAHIGSWDWDIKENKVSWSDELYNIYGVDREDFDTSYENYLSLIHPEDREKVHQAVQNSYRTFEPLEFTHRIIQTNGNIRILQSRGEVLTDRDNNPIKMSGTAQDITDIAMMSTALEQKNADLEKMNNELASFTYIASHDLQEPLRKIQMFTKRLVEIESKTLSDTAKDYFQRIERSAFRMQNLIEDLLSYSRTTNTIKKFEAVDLNEILKEVQENLKEKIISTHTIIYTAKLPKIHAIPYQMRQLFTNLITNSIKFCPEERSPEITISYSIQDEELRNDEGEFEGLKYHKIIFKDNGIGFETVFNDQIFGLFQRLHGKTEYEGTGIGLAICKKIMENHKGKITAIGEKDKGASFEILIPVEE